MSARRRFIKTCISTVVCCAVPSWLFAQKNNNLLFAPQNALPLVKIPQRILSAGRVADVLLMALCPEKLIGIATEIKEERKHYFSPSIRDIPYTGRLAGRGSTMSLEKVVALAPDVIIDVGNVNDTFLSTAEKVYWQTQIPYVLIDGRLADTPQQLLQLGAILGVEQRARELADYAIEILTLTQNICHDKKLKVYLGRSADGLETGLSGSIHTEVLEWLGAHNVATAAGEKRLTRISMEQLIMWEPDIILTQDRNFFERLQHVNIWQKLPAIQNKRYYLAPDEPFGWLDAPPGINRLLGCVWLAYILAPEKLSSKQALHQIERFFRLFYGHQLEEDQKFVKNMKNTLFFDRTLSVV